MSERNGWRAFGEIVADLRSKLIDESWFGRRPADQRNDALAELWGVDRSDGDGSSFARDWAVRDPSATASPEQIQEIGIDR